MAKRFAKDKVVERVIVASRTGTLNKKNVTFAYNKATDRYHLSVDGVVFYSNIAAHMVLTLAKNKGIKWD